MKKITSVNLEHDFDQATYKNYVTGFILSLVCTLFAYILVVKKVIDSRWALAGVVAVLALIQFVTQLTLFLHLGKESRPKFKLLVFCFMLSVVIILVAGSIWIMYNLNYRMSFTPTQVNQYLQNQNDGL
jgi:cytochrome o ubiquinol oxidase operon protein cyoD